MKRKTISIILLVVLVLGIAFTVSAPCNHNWELLYEEDSTTYYYVDDDYCAYDHIEHYKCTLCPVRKDMIYPQNVAHVFGPGVYVGTLPSGEQWWYHDCLNCGTRIDYYE